jgi:hypothetical protein
MLLDLKVSIGAPVLLLPEHNIYDSERLLKANIFSLRKYDVPMGIKMWRTCKVCIRRYRQKCGFKTNYQNKKGLHCVTYRMILQSFNTQTLDYGVK